MEVNVGKQKRSHFANLLSHRSVKDSFNRKQTTIAERYMKSKYNEGKRAKRKKVDEFGVEKSYYTLSSSQIENEPYSSRKPIKLQRCQRRF